LAKAWRLVMEDPVPEVTATGSPQVSPGRECELPL